MLTVRNAKSMLEEARRFGFVPIPLDSVNGKRPLLKGWTDKTVKDYQTTYDFYQNHSGNIGIVTGEVSGIIVIDIDLHDGGGEAWLELIEKHGNPETTIVRTGSGGFHYYFKFEDRVKHLKSRSKATGDGAGIDIKTTKGQVVYPGSLHPGCDPEGRNLKHKCGAEAGQTCKYVNSSYTWLFSPAEVPIISMPDWLLKVLEPVKEKRKKKKNVEVPVVQTSESKNYMFADANIEVSEEAIIELVMMLDHRRCEGYDSWLHVLWCLRKLSDKYIDVARRFSMKSEKFNEATFLEKWNQCDPNSNWTFSALLNWLSADVSEEDYLKFCQKHSIGNRHDSSTNPTTNLSDNDEGLAELYMNHCNGSMKIVDGKGNGYIWNHDNVIWASSFSIECKHAIRTVLAPVLKQLIEFHEKSGADKTEIEEKKEFIQDILDRKILSSHGLSGVFQSVHYKVMDKFFESKLDTSNLDELPMVNGMLINLRTGEIRKRTCKDLFTFECPVTYLGNDHPCANAARFFDQVFVHHKDLIDYVQRLFGYSMTGHVTDKSFYILWGEGNNGKTTLIELMKDIMGGFYSACDKEIFLKQEHNRGRDAASPSVMTLKGKRLSSCAETEDGKALDEPQVKMLTGGDTFTGRHLYKNPETFKCVAKLMMLTNAPPSYNTLAPAMQSRIKMIPFFAVFSRKPDKNNPNHFLIDEQFIEDLRTKYLSEIFTLLIRGARRWYESGLECPEICQLELQKHNESQDYLQQFINEFCHKDNPDAREKMSDFHRVYKLWCDKWKYPCMAPKDIKIHMKNKKYEPGKLHGYDIYKHIMFDPSKNPI